MTSISIDGIPPSVNAEVCSASQNFSDTPLTFDEENVLEIILNNTKRRGYCYAKNPALAEMSGKSIPTITRYVSKFCRMKLLIWRRVGKGRWLYPGPVDYPLIRQRLGSDEAQYTKETKEKYSYVCLSTDNEEVQSAQGHDAPTLPSACADGVEVRAPRVDGDGTANEVLMGEAEEEKRNGRQREIRGVTRMREEPDRRTEIPAVGVGRQPESGTQVHTKHAETGTMRDRSGDTGTIQTLIADCTKIAPELHQNREEERNADKSRGTGCIDRNVKSVESRSRTDENSRAQTRTNAEITYSLLDNPRGDRVCGEGAKTGIADTLIANGVDTREAVKLAAQFDSAHIRRCVLYLLQTEAKGHKVENRAGFLVAALRGGWAFKLCKQTPESIAKRHENARSCHAGSANEGRRYIPVPTKNYERTGADAPMSFLRGCLR